MGLLRGLTHPDDRVSTDNHVGWDVKLLPSLLKGFANDSAVKDEMKRAHRIAGGKGVRGVRGIRGIRGAGHS